MFYNVHILQRIFLNWRITAIVFVSAVQQRESALSVHLSPSCTALLSPPHATPLGRHGAPG